MTGTASKTILLVEDEPIIAMAAANKIRNFGYEVVTAHTGEHAVTITLSDVPINLILMDIDLGRGMDGTETARQILDKKAVPIVFLTSHAEKEFVDRVKKITRYGYVIKNSGDFVLQSSIEMAFDLFEAHEKITEELNERIRTEEALMESEKKFRALFEQASIGVAIVSSISGKYININQRHCDIVGYSREEMLAMTFHEITHPDDLEADLSYMERLRKNEISEFSMEKRFVHKNGSAIWIKLTVSPLWRTGESSEFHAAVVEDITERKLAEDRLRDARMLLQAGIESPKDIIIMAIDEYYNYLFFNNAHKQAMKYSYEKDVEIGMNVLDCITSEQDRKKARENYDRALKGESHSTIQIYGDINKTYYESYYNPIVNERHEVIGVTAFARDISRQKQAEEALKKSEIFYRSLFENMINAYAYCKMHFEHGVPADFTYLAVNNSFLKQTGLTNVVGKRVTEVIPGIRESDPDLFEIYGRVALTGRPESFEMYLESLKMWFLVTVFSPEKEYFAAVFDVITERKETEEALREREKLLRTIADNYPNSYLSIIEKDFTVGFTSGLEFKKSGLNPEHFIGMPLEQIFGDKTDYVRRYYEQTFNGRECSFELFINNQHQFYRTVPLYGEDGSINRILSVVEDITERRKGEEKIKSLLKEKELLLKEVHHRIKNNMSVIGGLLRLQADMVKEQSAAAALNDAGSRVQNMMLLYDKLYHSENLTGMPAEEYLSGLIDEIIRIFPNQGKVIITKNIENFFLEADILSPLSIIINEILTNTMKYAFTGRAGGSLSISAVSKERKAAITIRDDGIGIPDSVDFDTTAGFGLKLIGLLTEQIGGVIKIERGEGTKFILEFPLK